MARFIKCITGVSIALCMVFGILNSIFDAGVWLSLAITFATITYHFLMRLIVGFVFDKAMDNKADYSRAWFQVGPLESRFYNVIKVKKWKNKMPSYDPDVFSHEKHSWDEIAQAMCQAELVHETSAILSFLPILMTMWWGAFGVFLVTSICAALLDLSFVIMQRYNRPRVLRLAERER